MIATFFFLASWVSPVSSSQQNLKVKDVPRVMEKFFNLHIENKEWTPAIVRRCMKLYVEHFDSDKAYLLESEISAYLNMSDVRVQEVMNRLRSQDYSDFVELNQVIQKSILRAHGIRAEISENLSLHDVRPESASQSSPSQYASAVEELVSRQKNRMIRFYLFHKNRTRLESVDRRARVYALFEKKIRRIEHNYLFLASDGHALPKESIEHLMSLRILKSFAKSLDTHTSFFSPEEAYEMRLSLEKQFEGVGIILSEGIDGIMIGELIQGSPAEQSGKIHVNDLLVEIDGKDTTVLSLEEVLDLLKKRDRGEIILGFRRIDPNSQKETSFRVPLRKRPIVMNEERIQTSVEAFEDGVIGKISLHSFYESSDGVTSEKDIKEAIRSFQQKGELKGLVLDLRENSGGFLSQAVRVAGLFVSNGVIVISKYGKGDVHYLRNIVGKSFFNGPIVVLTSKMSASAAEIVAQALQDYGVAIVVGDERTFGKGSIQYQTVTDEKADLFFKITVGRYYTVSGRSTQINGVIADIVVPSQYAPYNIGEKFLEYPLPPDQVEAAYVDPLSDLDEKTRHIFQMRYLPFLQRVVPFWKRLLPVLRKNSAQRIASDAHFQAFLKKQEKIKARQSGLPVNTIDEQIQVPSNQDLQMIEAVNVVKDMIYLENESRAAASSREEFLKTGTEAEF